MVPPIPSFMGKRNYLVEGGSGTGKSSVCEELLRRGYQAINGDTELAYQGDPVTGEPLDGIVGADVHHHHIWRVDLVRAIAADHDHAVTFFCGGSRNVLQFIDLFDRVFVLEADLDAVRRRLDERGSDQWGGPGRFAERDLIERLHASRQDIPPNAIRIDASVSPDARRRCAPSLHRAVRLNQPRQLFAEINDPFRSIMSLCSSGSEAAAGRGDSAIPASIPMPA
jgi:hypothetical protein